MLFDGLDAYLRDYLYLKQCALVQCLILEFVLKSKKKHFFFIYKPLLNYQTEYPIYTNFSMKYLVMCNVYTDIGGIK